MIWLSDHPGGGDSFAGLLRAAGDLLASADAAASSGVLYDAVRGLAAWGERPSSSGCWDTEILALLLSRTLWACGEEECARRLTAYHCGPDVAALCWPPAADADTTRRRWRLCRSGVIGPSGRLFGRDANAWVLDARRLARIPECGLLELGLFAGLQTVLRCLAPAWDSTSGRGTLGLRGFGRRESASSGRPGAHEAGGFCDAVLSAEGDRRRWRSRPDIVLLDL